LRLCPVSELVVTDDLRDAMAVPWGAAVVSAIRLTKESGIITHDELNSSAFIENGEKHYLLMMDQKQSADRIATVLKFVIQSACAYPTASGAGKDDPEFGKVVGPKIHAMLRSLGYVHEEELESAGWLPPEDPRGSGWASDRPPSADALVTDTDGHDSEVLKSLSADAVECVLRGKPDVRMALVRTLLKDQATRESVAHALFVKTGVVKRVRILLGATMSMPTSVAVMRSLHQQCFDEILHTAQVDSASMPKRITVLAKAALKADFAHHFREMYPTMPHFDQFELRFAAGRPSVVVPVDAFLKHLLGQRAFGEMFVRYIRLLRHRGLLPAPGKPIPLILQLWLDAVFATQRHGGKREFVGNLRVNWPGVSLLLSMQGSGFFCLEGKDTASTIQAHVVPAIDAATNVVGQVFTVDHVAQFEPLYTKVVIESVDKVADGAMFDALGSAGGWNATSTYGPSVGASASVVEGTDGTTRFAVPTMSKPEERDPDIWQSLVDEVVKTIGKAGKDNYLGRIPPDQMKYELAHEFATSLKANELRKLVHLLRDCGHLGKFEKQLKEWKVYMSIFSNHGAAPTVNAKFDALDVLVRNLATNSPDNIGGISLLESPIASVFGLQFVVDDIIVRSNRLSDPYQAYELRGVVAMRWFRKVAFLALVWNEQHQRAHVSPSFIWSTDQVSANIHDLMVRGDTPLSLDARECERYMEHVIRAYREAQQTIMADQIRWAEQHTSVEGGETPTRDQAEGVARQITITLSLMQQTTVEMNKYVEKYPLSADPAKTVDPWDKGDVRKLVAEIYGLEWLPADFKDEVHLPESQDESDRESLEMIHAELFAFKAAQDMFRATMRRKGLSLASVFAVSALEAADCHTAGDVPKVARTTIKQGGLFFKVHTDPYDNSKVSLVFTSKGHSEWQKGSTVAVPLHDILAFDTAAVPHPEGEAILKVPLPVKADNEKKSNTVRFLWKEKYHTVNILAVHSSTPGEDLRGKGGWVVVRMVERDGGTATCTALALLAPPELAGNPAPTDDNDNGEESASGEYATEQDDLPDANADVENSEGSNDAAGAAPHTSTTVDPSLQPQEARPVEEIIWTKLTLAVKRGCIDRKVGGRKATEKTAAGVFRGLSRTLADVDVLSIVLPYGITETLEAIRTLDPTFDDKRQEMEPSESLRDWVKRVEGTTAGTSTVTESEAAVESATLAGCLAILRDPESVRAFVAQKCKQLGWSLQGQPCIVHVCPCCGAVCLLCTDQSRRIHERAAEVTDANFADQNAEGWWVTDGTKIAPPAAMDAVTFRAAIQKTFTLEWLRKTNAKGKVHMRCTWNRACDRSAKDLAMQRE